MKIIIEGQIPKKSVPEWVGMIMTCKFCNTIFELEEADYPRTVNKRGLFNSRFITISVHCPFCMATTSKEYKTKIK
jgi:hypothetical protein